MGGKTGRRGGEGSRPVYFSVEPEAVVVDVEEEEVLPGLIVGLFLIKGMAYAGGVGYL
jgi:hypothetical protein